MGVNGAERPPLSPLVVPDGRYEALLTFEQYLQLEEHETLRHEFVRGRRYAMSGALEAHNAIAGNAFFAFRARLRGGPCRVYNGDMMVRAGSADVAYYPDLHVECGEALQPKARYHERPVTIVEVLSRSTAAFDRGQKFEDYRTLPTLRAYVLIDSARRCVELRRLDASGDVTAITLHDGQTLDLPELGIAVPIAELYEQSGIA